MSRFAKILSRWLSAATMAAVVFMSLATTADAISRNFGFGSLGLVHDLSIVALLAAAFLGLAEVERTGENVNFNLLIEMMSPSLKRWLGGLAYALSAVCVGWATYVTTLAAWDAFQSNERMLGIAQLVTWPGRGIVALGFAALFVVMLVRCLAVFRGDAE